jgi:hypothetical protein
MRESGVFQKSAMRSWRDALTLGLNRGGTSPFNTCPPHHLGAQDHGDIHQIEDDDGGSLDQASPRGAGDNLCTCKAIGRGMSALGLRHWLQ